jgi:hypothetical protein
MTAKKPTPSMPPTTRAPPATGDDDGEAAGAVDSPPFSPHRGWGSVNDPRLKARASMGD